MNFKEVCMKLLAAESEVEAQNVMDSYPELSDSKNVGCKVQLSQAPRDL